MRKLSFLLGVLSALAGIACALFEADLPTRVALAFAVVCAITLLVREARCPACGKLALNVNPFSERFGVCGHCGERQAAGENGGVTAGSALVAAAGAALLALVALSLFLARPMTVGERYPFLDLSQCVRVEGYIFGDPGADDARFSIAPGDEGFDELLELVGAAEFRSGLAGHLPHARRAHRYYDGDFGWKVGFCFEGVPFPDGSVNSGELLYLDDFFGDLSLACDGSVTYCTVDAQALWLRQVLEIVSRYAGGAEG